MCMFVVIVEAEISAVPIGPFRSEEKAEKVAARWNKEHPGNSASVEPLLSYEEAEKEYCDGMGLWS